MEMEYLNDDTMHVFLEENDLISRGLTLSDIVKEDQEEIEKFFMSILEEADVSKRFCDSEAVTFQVMPNKNGVDLYISKSTPDQEPSKALLDNWLHNLSQREGDFENEEDQDTLPVNTHKGWKTLAIEYESLDDLISAACDFNFDEIYSDLYVYKGHYYVIFSIDASLYSNFDVQNLMYYLLEYGQVSSYHDAFIREHGKLLLQYKAIQLAKQYFK